MICFTDTLSDSTAGSILQNSNINSYSLQDDTVPYYLRPKDPVVGRASTEQLLVAATGRPVTHSDIVAAVGTLGGTPFRIHSRYLTNNLATVTITVAIAVTVTVTVAAITSSSSSVTSDHTAFTVHPSLIRVVAYI